MHIQYYSSVFVRFRMAVIAVSSHTKENPSHWSCGERTSFMLDDPSTFWLDVSRKGKDVRGIKVKFSAFILGLLIVKSVSFTFKKISLLYPG